LRRDVLDELEWEPSLDARNIAVTVKDGVVTLSGNVSSYYQKWEAEKAAKRVAGVKAVANDIEIRLPSSSERTDADIAHAAVTALSSNVLAPADRIKVTVENGWVTLEGQVDWQFERDG
jgi:osmotically-inducible protein OsmY